MGEKEKKISSKDSGWEREKEKLRKIETETEKTEIEKQKMINSKDKEGERETGKVLKEEERKRKWKDFEREGGKAKLKDRKR